MSVRPSKFVMAIARWALMSGLAGIVMSVLALLDSLRSPDNSDGRRTLLLLAAVLLSLTFVLAPFVRRAFAPPSQAKSVTRAPRKTLLDEMRESGGASTEHESQPLAEPSITAEGANSGSRSPVARLLIIVYAVFALVLACALWALQR